ALCAVGMAGALAGFLVYNLPPARIRLGSAGASLIGFLIASLTILIAQGGTLLAASTVPFLAVLGVSAGAACALLRRGWDAARWLPRGSKAAQAALPQRGVKPHAS